jgi:putative peptidoglycan lipid II flippase
MADETSRVIKDTGVFAFGTFLSRISGLIRDFVIAWAFGASMMSDAFFVAFAIPNFFRRLMGEGALGVAVVPVYVRYLKGDNFQEAQKAFRSLLGSTLIILSLSVILGILFAPFLVRLQMWGWSGKEVFDLTVSLTRLCFPYLFMISLVALFMGILNSHGHFFAPAVSPVFLNLSLILSALFLSPFFTPPIKALGVGVLLGGVLQLVLQLPFLKKNGLPLKPNFDLMHPAAKETWRLTLPMVLGLSVFQINQIVDRVFASFLPHGSVSYLYYADRIFELPIGLFAVGIGVAALPNFSKRVSEGRSEEFKKEVNLTLRWILFLTIPISIFFIFFRVPIVSVLFQHGSFGPEETIKTASALLAYSISIWAYGGIHVLSRAFYAQKETKIPVRSAMLGSVLNFFGDWALVGPLKHTGLAFATSASAILNFLILFFFFHREVGIERRLLLMTVTKVSLASLGAVPFLMWIQGYGRWLQGGTSFQNFLVLLIGCFGSLIIFFGLAILLRLREVRILLGIIGPRA